MPQDEPNYIDDMALDRIEFDHTAAIIAGVALGNAIKDRMKSVYFLPALYLIQQSCFSVGNVRISNKRMLCETCVFIASAQAYAVRTGLRKVLRG